MDAVVEIAVRTPAVLVLGYVFLQVLKMVLDTLGRKIDRLAEAWEAHNRRHP